MLMPQETGSVSSETLLAFDIISNKGCKIVDDAQLLILLPMKTRKAACDNTIISRAKHGHESSVMCYLNDHCSIILSSKTSIAKVIRTE